ncbi:MAG TPA: hypothetical protein VKE95_22110 [Burkholderiales bacterium]|nr:hypothetical protein [Burkholderiales bacterium]
MLKSIVRSLFRILFRITVEGDPAAFRNRLADKLWVLAHALAPHS